MPYKNTIIDIIIIITNLIQEKNYTQVSSQLDSFKKYAAHYLVKDGTYRSNCFIKIMTMLKDLLLSKCKLIFTW